MESTNFKMIIDKTFLLLDQVISEKKAERGAAKHQNESCRLENSHSKNTLKQQYKNGDKI